ncbi:unnamed protein product [Parajaminaea phylloscopi]
MTLLPDRTPAREKTDTSDPTPSPRDHNGAVITDYRRFVPVDTDSQDHSPITDIDDEEMPPPKYSPSVEAPPSVEDSLSDPQIELDELQRAVLDIPDSEASESDEGGLPEDEASALQVATDGTTTIGDPNRVQPQQQLTGPLQGSGINGEWELQDWLRVSNQSLGFASAATSAGFSVAKGVTGMSLFLAKRFTQLAVALPAMLVDSANGAVPGSEQATFSALAHSGVGGFFDLISTLALGGIDLGSSLTSAGLGAASSGVEGVRRALGSEVIKSLGQFVKLVQREWHAENDSLPPGGIPSFGLTGVTRAIIVWICIQMVTQESYERKMLKELEEVDVVALRKEIESDQEQRHRSEAEARSRTGAQLNRVRITSSEHTTDRGDVIGAEVGSMSAPQPTSAQPVGTPRPFTDKEALAGLLRYSSLVLAVYGGTALAWLGALPKDDAEAARVAQDQGAILPAATGASRRGGPLSDNAPLPSDGLTREQDEEQFLMAAAMMDLTESERETQEKEFSHRPPRPAIDRSTGHVIFSADEAEGQASNSQGAHASGPSEQHQVNGGETGATSSSTYTYLNLLSGRHDEELFHRVGNVDPQHVRPGSYEPVVGGPREPPRDREAVARPSQPRYYIVTDHKAQKVVLVLRGSLSLGDIAADLTCESREFHFPDPDSRGSRKASKTDDVNVVPFPASEASTSLHSSKRQEDTSATAMGSDEDIKPLVHEGMYETALAVGSPHAPVHRAVRLALQASPNYALDIAGHSLGAGVASILAILWANPATCLTTAASGLPPGHRVHAYCYACPATMSKELGGRCEALITTYTYSYDLVCRLSLGSILDIRNAAAWILWEDRQEQARAAQSAQSGTNGRGAAGGGFDPGNRSTPLRVPALMRRAFEHQSGRLDPEVDKQGNVAEDDDIKAQTEQDFLALRTTLEANMRNVELYPPGQVLYLFKAGELLQTHFGGPTAPRQPPTASDADTAASAPPSDTAAPPASRKRASARAAGGVTDRQRAFVLRRGSGGGGGNTVGKRENVFGQIIFSRRLLSSHMPQHYDAALRGLE